LLRMLSRKLHTRSISRLMAGLFAMQLFAAGFCLMTPQVHAMPMAMGISHSADMVAEHCSEPMNEKMDAKMDHSACTHCDQPDELFQSVKTPIDSKIAVFALINVELQEISVDNSSLNLTSLIPTGPPRSSSLIYTTTKRIRI